MPGEPQGSLGPDEEGRESSPVYHLVVASGFGRIWTTRPTIQQDGLLTVLRSSSGRQHKAPGPGRPCFTAVAFSCRAETLATVDNCGNVFLFHITKNRYARLDWNCHAGTAVAFAPWNKAELYAAFQDGTIRVYDVKGETRQLLTTLKGHQCPVRHISTTHNGNRMVTTSAESIKLWDMKTYTELQTLGSGPFGAVQADHTRDDESMLASFKDDTIWVWEARDLSRRVTINLPRPIVPASASPCSNCFVVSEKQKWLVVGGPSSMLQCWDLKTLRFSHAVAMPGWNAVRQLHPMPDDRTVAALGSNGVLYFVDIEKASETYKIAGDGKHGGPAEHFTVDKRGNHACLVSKEGEALLYDLFTLRKAFHGREAKELQRFSLEELVAAGAGQEAEKTTLGAASNAAEFLSPGYGSAVGHLSAPGPRAWAVASGAADGQPRSGKKLSRPGLRSSAVKSAPKNRSVPSRTAPLADVKIFPDSNAPGLSRKRLRALLDAYGEYPEKYRLQIWQYLLEIPGNAEAHAALYSKGIHTSFRELGSKYPLQNRALLLRLQRVLSCLAYWAPILGEVDFFPAMVFPFVKLFGADERTCFEVMATFITNWAAEWFCMFPHPPLPVLGQVEKLMLFWDAGLRDSMARSTGGFQAASWSLLRTLMTELLSRQEWLKVFDHVVTNDTGFLYFIVTSVVRHLKQRITSAAADDLPAFFQRSQPVDVNKVIKHAYDMRRETPAECFPPNAPLKPLPAGSLYPEFKSYNKKVVDFQMAERQRLEEEERALLRKRQVVKDLEQHTRSLLTQQAAWGVERSRLLALENERRAAIREQEVALRAEMSKLDDKSKEERLRQIDIIEATFRTNMETAQQQWIRELENLRLDIDQKRAAAMMALESRKQEEAIKALEFQASQRMWSMQEESQRNAVAERLQQKVAMQTMQADMEYQKRVADWEAQDKQGIILKQHDNARRAQLARAKEEARLQQNVETEIFRSELEKELGIRHVEMERKLRSIAEKEAALTAEALEAQRVREEAMHAEEANLLKAKANEDQEWYDAQSRKRAERLARQEAARQKEIKERAAMIDDIERAGRVREAEAHLLERRRMLERQNLAEEREIARVLDLMEEQRALDQKALHELKRSKSELEGRLAHARQVATGQLQVEEEEHTRFDELRSQLALKRAEAEAEQQRRHQELMAQLALEREKTLLDLDASWRKNVARSEMGWFQEESRRYTEAKEAMDRAALASERSAAREVAQLRRRAMAAAVAEDPAVAAAAAAAGAGLGDSSSQSISSSPSKSSASDDLGELPRHGIARGEEASPTPTGSQEPGRRDDSSVMQPHSLAGVHRTTAVLPPSSGSRTAEQTSGSSDMSRPHHLVLHESATESGEGPSVGGSDSVAVSRTRPEPEPQQPPFLANYRWGSPTRSASSVAASSVTLTPNMSAAARYAEETLAALGATASPSAQRGDSSVPSSLDGPSNLSERLAALGIDTGAPISPRSFSGGDQQLARPALSGNAYISSTSTALAEVTLRAGVANPSTSSGAIPAILLPSTGSTSSGATKTTRTDPLRLGAALRYSTRPSVSWSTDTEASFRRAGSVADTPSPAGRASQTLLPANRAPHAGPESATVALDRLLQGRQTPHSGRSKAVEATDSPYRTLHPAATLQGNPELAGRPGAERGQRTSAASTPQLCPLEPPHPIV